MFYIEENMLRKGTYKISMKMELYTTITRNGPIDASFNVVPARLLGLSYRDFLVYIYQNYEASIHTRNGKYATFSFPNKEVALPLVALLNKKWYEIYPNKI